MRASPLVAILDVDDPLTSLAQRAALEYWGATVRLAHVATPADFVRMLRDVEPATRLVLLNGHGDRRGLLFPELTAALIPNQPFYPCAAPADVRRLAPLPPVPVLATACGPAPEQWRPRSAPPGARRTSRRPAIRTGTRR